MTGRRSFRRDRLIGMQVSLATVSACQQLKVVYANGGHNLAKASSFALFSFSSLLSSGTDAAVVTNT
jgi:hypothetical protein